MTLKKMTPQGAEDMSAEEVRQFLAGQVTFAEQTRTSELRKAALTVRSW